MKRKRAAEMRRAEKRTMWRMLLADGTAPEFCNSGEALAAHPDGRLQKRFDGDWRNVHGSPAKSPPKR